ncbi:hypothetical protein [Isachenkonia alkalipeptolytica]|uniref:Uncharacterized protein n=1 Tax=Isachenkonia alkalipeptolytica TaxID=2565777 RepID=A0AA44BEN2_9CLOT|nr:hypothetical protein [Isachenkonia alkalipeptolytica]NBG87716.1 hypothetical protein [Isachenkonia alkalipeptolytica]
MLKKGIIGILVGMILIYGVYALINWIRDVEDVEEMTVTQLSYDEVPENIQETIDEINDFRLQSVHRRSIITDRHSRAMVSTRYEIFVPPEGERLEIIEIAEEDIRQGVMRAVYTFVEKEGETVDEMEDVVILRVDNYIKGEFRTVFVDD